MILYNMSVCFFFSCFLKIQRIDCIMSTSRTNDFIELTLRCGHTQIVPLSSFACALCTEHDHKERAEQKQTRSLTQLSVNLKQLLNLSLAAAGNMDDSGSREVSLVSAKSRHPQQSTSSSAQMHVVTTLL